MKATDPFLSEGCPQVVADLDLTRSGMFEASAGTGKTYAIEHLVLRLLLESPELDLPKILILTYTEKATGELKEKIRNRITLRLSQGNLSLELTDRLKSALLGFDRASIYTIHGFCDRVLKKYAFENHGLFQNLLVKKDKELYQEVLKEEMRSTWLSEASSGPDGLIAFKSLIDSVGFKNSSNSKWDEKLLSLAQEFNPERGDKLFPEYSFENHFQFENILADLPAKIFNLIPGLVAGQESQHPFFQKFKAIQFANTTIKKKGRLAILAALQLATQHRDTLDSTPTESTDKHESHEDKRAIRILAVNAFLGGIGIKAVYDKSFHALAPTGKECPEIPWPELDALLDILTEAQIAAAKIEIELRAKSFSELRRVILSLREKTQAHKREQGLITFNDMIESVWKALEENPESKKVLRQDYRYCLVDEFQDTDPLQWNIFRSIFLESTNQSPLYLIGDPKQAIYRFRGGDIHTYMAARKSMHELSRRGLAQGMGLDTNFRSSPPMVQAFNEIFTQDGWFHSLQVDPEDTAWHLPAEPDPLGYVFVKHGGLAIQEAMDKVYGSAPIILRDFSSADNEKKNAIQRRTYAWIAAEIKNLMEKPENLCVPDKGGNHKRPVQLKDICILVSSHSEKSKIEKACTLAGIPFKIEKQTGLYASDAAAEFLAILESLEDLAHAGKHARALLTRFFRYSGQPAPKALPQSIHPIFETWARMADRKQWQKLFHSLLYQTGLLYRTSLEPNGDRIIMDFIHLGQNLVGLGLGQPLNLSGLVQTLRQLHSGNNQGEDDEDFHREDSDGGKVTLMTMHVSKGLEFPVVFLAACSPGRGPKYFKYRQELNTIYHLDTNDERAKAAHKLESENEIRRLFYVALTRARFKLYIPLFPEPTRTNYGPLGGFVAQALKAAAAKNPGLFFWSNLEPAAIALPAISDQEQQFPANPQSTSFADYPQFDPLNPDISDFNKRRRRLTSYSHLVHHTHALSVENQEGRFDKEEAPLSDGPEIIDLDKEIAEGKTKNESSAILFPANALPRGKAIGNMLHEILEKIDFAQVAQAADPPTLLQHLPSLELIQERMRHHRLEEKWIVGVAEIIWHALNTKLPDPAGGEPFSLSEVKDLRPEMEFLFPYHMGLKSLETEGFLGGFIDLVFRHQGRYYLLDWKSNYLENYQTSDLNQSMLDSNYDLQYRLYAMALDKWLRSLLPHYEFSQHFGGIYYLYLRGMVRRDPQNHSGIFCLRPSESQILQDYPLHLAEVMEASGANVQIDAGIFLNQVVGLP